MENEKVSMSEQLKDEKTGGKEITIDSYTEAEKKEGEVAYGYSQAPDLNLCNDKNPEVEDLQMGDTVKLIMKVTGINEEIVDGKTKTRVTLSLTAK